jgi:hypothetical protein
VPTIPRAFACPRETQMRTLTTLVGRFQNSNHIWPSKRPQFSVQKRNLQQSGFMESVV